MGAVDTPHAGQRQPGWAQRLGDLVAARLDKPFAWWTNDCLSFVADAVQAQHGRDTLAESRTPRASQRQAAAKLRAAGGLAAGLVRAGLLPVAPALAGVGDVVLLRQGRKKVVALCNGDVALSPGPDGLMCSPMWQAVAAWRV